MATVGTHDVPPVAGFVTGDQVTVRARLGLLNRPEEAERGEAERMLARWQAALVGRGPARRPARSRTRPSSPWRCTATWRRTPAVLLGVSLADAVGDAPDAEHPRHQRRVPELADPALRRRTAGPVLLEDLPGAAAASAAVAAAASSRPRP